MLARLLVVALTFFPLAARACDLCGCYTRNWNRCRKRKFPWPGSTAPLPSSSPISARFNSTIMQVANPPGNDWTIRVTQFVVGYEINDRFALQFNAPFIYRDFRRPEGFAIDEGTQRARRRLAFGQGRALAFRFTPRGVNSMSKERSGCNRARSDCTCSIVALAGLKFLRAIPAGWRKNFTKWKFRARRSGIHGHDLTLGTGSYDGIFGTQSSLRYKNFFAEANGQFTLRGDGAHDYHFANDLTWNAGPGYYLRAQTRSFSWIPMRGVRRKQGCRSFSRPRG